jgi:hypothetical protein
MRAHLTLSLSALMALAAVPAFARPELYQCKFSERCTENGCEAMRETYSFQLDVDTGDGKMMAGGSDYQGLAVASDTTHTFFFINSAGAEMVTINMEGYSVVYSGHMGFGPDLGTYKLTGTCLKGQG